MVKRQTPKYLEKMLFVNYKADQALEKQLVELGNVSRTRMMELKRQRINVRNEYRYIRRGSRSLPATTMTSETPAERRRAVTPPPPTRGFYPPPDPPKATGAEEGDEALSPDSEKGAEATTDRAKDSQKHGGKSERQDHHGGRKSRREQHEGRTPRRPAQSRHTPRDGGGGRKVRSTAEHQGEITSRSDNQGKTTLLQPQQGGETSRSEPPVRQAVSRPGGRGQVLLKDGKKFFPADTSRQRPVTQGGSLTSSAASHGDFRSLASARVPSSERVEGARAECGHEKSSLPALGPRHATVVPDLRMDSTPRNSLRATSGSTAELPPMSARNSRDMTGSLPLSASYRCRTSARQGRPREQESGDRQGQAGHLLPTPAPTHSVEERNASARSDVQKPLRETLLPGTHSKGKHHQHREETRHPSSERRKEDVKMPHSTRGSHKDGATAPAHSHDHPPGDDLDKKSGFEIPILTSQTPHTPGSRHPMHEFLLAESRRAADVIPNLLLSLHAKEVGPASNQAPEKASSAPVLSRTDGLPDMLHIHKLARSIHTIYAEISENRKIDLLRSRVSVEDLLREVRERAKHEEAGEMEKSLTDGTYVLLRRKLNKLQATAPALPRLPPSLRQASGPPRLPTLSRAATSLDKPDPVLERNMRAQLAEEDRRNTGKKVALERVHYDRLLTRVSSFLQMEPPPRIVTHDDSKSEVSV